MCPVHHGCAVIQSGENPTLMYFESLRGRVRLAHAVSTRTGSRGSPGAFDLAWAPDDDPGPVRARIAAVCAALGMDARAVCCARQVHGDRVVRVEGPGKPDPSAPCTLAGECDAMITNHPGVLLLIRVADCVPLVVFDPVRRAVAAVHAGWKGTLAGIAAAAVAAMRDSFGCEPFDLLAGIGPSIGPCCFEVGPDIAGSFADVPAIAGCVRRTARRSTVNLPEANRRQLLDCGVPSSNIELSGLCTGCRLDVFFSHRGEQGETGRFGLFAGLRA